MAIPSGLPWMTYGRINSKTAAPETCLGKNQDNQTAVSRLWFLQYKICIYNYIITIYIYICGLMLIAIPNTIQQSQTMKFTISGDTCTSPPFPELIKKKAGVSPKKVERFISFRTASWGFQPISKRVIKLNPFPKGSGVKIKHVLNLQLQNGPLLVYRAVNDVMKWPIVKLKSQYISKEGIPFLP